MNKRGKFITLEGMDGAGKSTHIPGIIQLLKTRGVEVVSTREPGGSTLGEKLRELLLQEEMQPETEALLMFAARQEHLAQLILPALSRGAYVVSDRFTDASFAYQAAGRGLAIDKMQILEHWVQADLQPDLTLLFDVPVEVSIARLATARTPDKFERESADFFTRIRNAYLQRAHQYPERFAVINANRSIEDVWQSVHNVISSI